MAQYTHFSSFLLLPILKCRYCVHNTGTGILNILPLHKFCPPLSLQHTYFANVSHTRNPANLYFIITFMDVCCIWNCDPKKCTVRIPQSVQQLGCTINDPGFNPGLGEEFLSSTKHLNQLWVSIQPPTQWVSGALSLWHKVPWT